MQKQLLAFAYFRLANSSDCLAFACDWQQSFLKERKKEISNYFFLYFRKERNMGDALAPLGARHVPHDTVRAKNNIKIKVRIMTLVLNGLALTVWRFLWYGSISH
jgi:hypothetical protein